MRELKGDPKPIAKIELARDYMELNPGLLHILAQRLFRKDFIQGLMTLGFVKHMPQQRIRN